MSPAAPAKPETRYILAHDVGTSGNKAVIVTTAGEVVGQAGASYDVLFPQPGWAEQDPRWWWDAVCESTRAVMTQTGVTPGSIVGVSFSGQMGGTVPVDARGEPTMNALIWLDTRSEPQAKAMTRGLFKIAGYGLRRVLRWLRVTNGAPNLSGKDYTSQVIWVKERAPGVWARTHKFLAVKGYLLLRATGRFVMTQDSANLTWCMDTRTREWSDNILAMIGLPRAKLPTLVSCTDVVGTLTPEAAEQLGLAPETPVVGGAGDIVVATIGAGAVREAEFHLYIGTSDWVTAHVSEQCLDTHAATGTIHSAHPDRFLIIAEQETAGACLEWAQNQLYHKELLLREEGSENIYDVFDRLVEQCAPGADGVLFTPWMFGERAPYDDHTLRAGLVNLSLEHRREHVVRAIFEGIALNIRTALEVVEGLAGRPAEYVRFAGGGAKSATWCQILADVLQRPIHQVQDPQEAGARGAALVAAHALGHLPDFDAISDIVPVTARFAPDPGLAALYDAKFAQFTEYHARMKKWFRRHNQFA